jgi:hypothetical protein
MKCTIREERSAPKDRPKTLWQIFGRASRAMNRLDPITFHFSHLAWTKTEFILCDPCLTLGPARELVRAL